MAKRREIFPGFNKSFLGNVLRQVMVMQVEETVTENPPRKHPVNFTEGILVSFLSLRKPLFEVVHEGSYYNVERSEIQFVTFFNELRSIL